MYTYNFHCMMCETELNMKCLLDLKSKDVVGSIECPGCGTIYMLKETNEKGLTITVKPNGK